LTRPVKGSLISRTKIKATKSVSCVHTGQRRWPARCPATICGKNPLRLFLAPTGGPDFSGISAGNGPVSMAARATPAMRLVVIKRYLRVREAKEIRAPAPRPPRVLSACVLPLSDKREWGDEDDKNSDDSQFRNTNLRLSLLTRGRKGQRPSHFP